MERVAPATASNRWSYRDRPDGRLDDDDDDAETKTKKQTRRRSSRASRVGAGHGVDDDEDDGAVDPCVRMSDSS